MVSNVFLTNNVFGFRQIEVIKSQLINNLIELLYESSMYAICIALHSSEMIQPGTVKRLQKED